jgi:F0F1-type ATP synthase assembly protein I
MFHNDPDDERRRMYRQMGIAMGMPFALALGPIVGYFIGKWLDAVAHTGFLVYVFLTLGFVAGVRVVIDMVKRLG